LAPKLDEPLCESSKGLRQFDRACETPESFSDLALELSLLPFDPSGPPGPPGPPRPLGPFWKVSANTFIGGPIAEAHGGKFTVHDRAPRGLIARITLPPVE